MSPTWGLTGGEELVSSFDGFGGVIGFWATGVSSSSLESVRGEGLARGLFCLGDGTGEPLCNCGEASGLRSRGEGVFCSGITGCIFGSSLGSMILGGLSFMTGSAFGDLGESSCFGNKL